MDYRHEDKFFSTSSIWQDLDVLQDRVISVTYWLPLTVNDGVQHPKNKLLIQELT
jgi:hypothetical protein